MPLRGKVGDVAKVDHEIAGGNLTRGVALLAIRSDWDSGFCRQYISSAASRSRLEMTMNGSALQEIPIATLRGFKVAFPPTLAEQQAIAAALGDADAYIDALAQRIAKQRLVKQGAMQELLTGKRRLPGFVGEWEVKAIDEIVSRLTNGALYRPSSSVGIRVTRIETIAEGYVDFSRTGLAEPSPDLEPYKMQKGDILFSHINSLDHIGKVAQYKGESELFHGMNLVLIRTNDTVNNQFLYYWFTSDSTRKATRTLAKQAVSQASINTKELRALTINLPSLAEQTAIAAILSDMDAAIAALEAKLAKARLVKQGMMQALLTGRVRLV
jgi:type I restriction enzyme S subunit